MNYAKIRNYDIANGEGVRTSLFVSGCTNHCDGCFNQREQDFDYGIPFTIQTLRQICELLDNPVISGLSLLGGDPMCQDEEGLFNLTALCVYAHQIGKNVWLWTGFLWEDIYNVKSLDSRKIFQRTLLCNCDVVVDGPFKKELSNRVLKWCGSANQRIIDVKKTISERRVILYG